MNASMSGFLQFIIGFVLGIIFFSAGIAGGAYFFLTRVGVNPPEPVFSEEEKSSDNTELKTGESTSKSTQETREETTSSSTKPTEEPAQETLPPGAYRARVTWSTGLSLRAEPSIGAERIGGVGYNWELIVLSVSQDQNWQKVRIPSSGQEGWVKAGNTAKIEDQEQ